MIVRRAAERGHADHGWLLTYHTFSFADYHDPAHMGFRALRVINEDRVQPARGFGTHAHRDMEIVTWVLDGVLAHRDSMGHEGEIRPGELQRMSAGTGVSHSEFNGSEHQLVHFLQIWIVPERRGLAPSYEQRRFPPEERRGRLRLVASRAGRDGSATVHQDVDVYCGLLERGVEVALEPRAGRGAWIHVARGAVGVAADRDAGAGGAGPHAAALAAGDGAAIEGARRIAITGSDDAEILVFDLA